MKKRNVWILLRMAQGRQSDLSVTLAEILSLQSKYKKPWFFFFSVFSLILSSVILMIFSPCLSSSVARRWINTGQEESRCETNSCNPRQRQRRSKPLAEVFLTMPIVFAPKCPARLSSRVTEHTWSPSVPCARTQALSEAKPLAPLLQLRSNQNPIIKGHVHAGVWVAGPLR